MAKYQCVAWGASGSTGWPRARNIDGRLYVVRLNDNNGQLGNKPLLLVIHPLAPYS